MEDIKIYGLFNSIKYAYQRVRDGYDERIMWEFDSYFNQFLKPLKKFCEEKLKDRTDEKRTEIFSKTLVLIQECNNMTYEDQYKTENQVDNLWAYVGKHIRWYWD